ncbi:MAG: hypothetical protein ACKERG_00920 [Candidatus Hodgkinia cicadicola]
MLSAALSGEECRYCGTVAEIRCIASGTLISNITQISKLDRRKTQDTSLLSMAKGTAPPMGWKVSKL